MTKKFCPGTKKHLAEVYFLDIIDKKAKKYGVQCVQTERGAGSMKPIQQISDLLDLESLQKMQDNFSRSMNLGFITVDYKGRPITQPSGFTDFCSKAREKVAFREMCFQCDAHGGLHAAITGVPYIYRCHADLVDFAVPLILEGSYVGAVLGGQAKLRDKEVNQLEYLIPQQLDWKKDPELVKAREKIEVTEYSKVESSVTLLRNMIQYLLDEAYKRKQELEEGATAERLATTTEMSLSESDAQRLYYILNVASKLAYQEKAPRTEGIICDFADMLRYSTRKGDGPLVTLEEELEYITRFLRVQKTQRGDQLSYQIEVPEQCKGAGCPHMLLRPLVENALRGLDHDPGKAVSILITGKVEREELLLYVRDNGAGISVQAVESILDTQGYRADGVDERMNLYNMNRKLKGFFGPRYGLTIRSIGDGLEGTEVCVRLPLGAAEALRERAM